MGPAEGRATAVVISEPGRAVKVRGSRAGCWSDLRRNARGRGAVVKGWLGGRRGNALRGLHRLRLDRRPRAARLAHLVFKPLHALLELDYGFPPRPTHFR